MRQRDGDASCLFRNRIKFLLWNAIILSSIHSFIYTIIVIMLSSMSNIYWFRFRTAIYGIIIIKIHIREFCFSFVFCLSLAGHEMSTLDNWFVHLPRACISLTSANTIDVIFFIVFLHSLNKSWRTNCTARYGWSMNASFFLCRSPQTHNYE